MCQRRRPVFVVWLKSLRSNRFPVVIHRHASYTVTTYFDFDGKSSSAIQDSGKDGRQPMNGAVMAAMLLGLTIAGDLKMLTFLKHVFKDLAVEGGGGFVKSVKIIENNLDFLKILIYSKISIHFFITVGALFSPA